MVAEASVGGVDSGGGGVIVNGVRSGVRRWVERQQNGAAQASTHPSNKYNSIPPSRD